MYDNGMNISGIWINKITGEKIEVRDSIILGDDIIIILMDGRTINMLDFSNNFFQMSEAEYGLNIPDSKYGGLDDENLDNSLSNSNDDSLHNFSLDTPVFSSIPKTSDNHESELSNNTVESNVLEDTCNKKASFSIKDEAISKIMKDNKPVCSIRIEWDNPPKNEILLLKKYFDVTNEDIINYIINNCDLSYDIIHSYINNLCE